MYDVRTGALFDRTERVYRSEAVQEFMHAMHVLHVRMGMDEGGRDFLAVMCALSVVSIVTGVYLYLPMMKSLAFGVRRRRSSRLFWSDWHKLASIFAGTWAVLMCVSGIFIVLYSIGIRDYHRTAHALAAEHFAVHTQDAPLISAEEAYARIAAEFPQKDMISMRLPTADSAYYIFQIAEPTVRATDFALGEQAYLPASGDGAPLFVPVPAWLTMAPFFLNLHIHNHELLAEKIFWALLILMTAAMIVTGIVLWMTRWRSCISAAADAAQRRTNAAWEEPARVAVLTMLVMIAPMYGGIGEGLALALSAYLVFYFVRAVRR